MERKDKLIDHRFILKKVDLGILHSLRSGYEEVRKKHPEIKGLSFYGSRTKGSATYSCDIDSYLFYDGSNLGDSESSKIDKLRSVGKVLKRYSIKPGGQRIDAHLHMEDISEKVTHKLLEEYSQARYFGEGILSLFFLGIGDGLYEHRAYILRVLEQKVDGEQIFKSLMTSLKLFERKPWEPVYDRYPESIREAKDYFQLGKTIV